MSVKQLQVFVFILSALASRSDVVYFEQVIAREVLPAIWAFTMHAV